MHRPLITDWVIRASIVLVAIILVLLPFHASLTVWLSQVVGHYTLLRLWKETLLVLLVLGAIYVCVQKPAIRREVLRSKLTWVIIAFLAVQLAWGLVAYMMGNVTAKALGYGWIVDSRFLVFFLVVWVFALSSPRLVNWWPRLLFIPAVVVITVGLLQYLVLPYDFLKYLGYSAATIFPYEDINHNTAYIRVMSTLRGANPLGAYLVMIISLLATWGGHWIRTAKTSQLYRRLGAVSLYAVASILVLALSFSRGAWLGLAASLAVIIWLRRRDLSAKLVTVGASLLVVVLVFGTVALVARNPIIQNVLLHTEDDSTIAATSNQGHASALQTGLSELAHEPLGRGPGTAGPASVYNAGHPLRIAENYFIQIGQETGWLGLLLFVDILVNIARLLFARRERRFALGLLTALAGLTVINFTSHAWADDTLAYLWWGLAGIAVALPLPKRQSDETTD